MDFRRSGPSPDTLAWAERALGPGFRVVAARRMTGGITSAVHRLTADRNGRRVCVVLRQYEHAVPPFTTLARREADIMRGVRAAGLAAPEPIAVCADGADAGGRPSLLMTRLPGHLELAPGDPAGWLGQMAATAAAIHHAPVSGTPFEPWINPDRLTVPVSARHPELWQAAIAILRQQPPARPGRFLHRDFQHFNLLWTRGRLTGIVDWGAASDGPPEIDTGHCRLNLAVLYSADRAERFRLAYQAEAGRDTDPWWDLHAIASYSDAWPRFIPVQVARRVRVDTAGMTARIEELLRAVLGRL